MTCTHCNTSGPHEFIDGLCHSCTAKELQRLKAKENEVCEWSKNMFGIKTQCDNHISAYLFSDMYTHCPYCGKKIKIV